LSAVVRTHPSFAGANERAGKHNQDVLADSEGKGWAGPHFSPFLTLTGDYRDLAATTAMSPTANSWLAAEGSYGNGFLDRLEHRKEFMLNGGERIKAGNHDLTLAGIAYVGYGNVAGLRPIFFRGGAGGDVGSCS